MRVAKALTSIGICADSPEPSLLADAINIKISCTGPYIVKNVLLLEHYALMVHAKYFTLIILNACSNFKDIFILLF